MKLGRYGRILTRWWWLLALAGLLGGGGAYTVSHLMTPIYRAEVTLLVNQTQTPGIIAYNDVLTSERLTMTYAELLTGRPVLQDVVESIDAPITADQLASMTHVQAIEDTQLLRLSVEDADPELAQRLANATAEQFIASNAQQGGLTRPGTVSIVEPATTPGGPVRPRTELNTFIGALAGLFVAGIVISVYEYLDDTLKTKEEVEAAAGIPTLGSVARFGRGNLERRGLTVASEDRTPAAEAYRVLRTNLQFSTLDARALLVSSANPKEGKTTTVANLGVAIAQTGQRVIVVDSDLRRPALHGIFGLSSAAGLTNALLLGGQDLEQLLQQTRFENLRVLASGPLPPNPAELLNSPRMDSVIQTLRQRADILLFDSPPTGAVADASILAAKVDGAILVVDAGRPRAEALRSACEALSRSKTKVLGAVLNKLTDRGGGYYTYGSYYAASPEANGHRRRWLPRSWRPRAAWVGKSLSRILLAVGLALVLLATAVGLLGAAVRLAWQKVPPPPPAAVTFEDRAVAATSQAYGSSALLLPAQPADLQDSIRLGYGSFERSKRWLV